MHEDPELVACTPYPLSPAGFNPGTILPYGLTTDHVCLSMNEFLSFLSFINNQLHTRQMLRLEQIIMQATFSSLVGEFVKAAIPKYCPTIVKNLYHNGHPDLIPVGRFPGDAVQHSQEGIEVKSSRYLRGWQGHNPEDIWLMVFVYDSNSPADGGKNIGPKPFRFIMVVGSQLTRSDWLFAGRSETSRRTITASVTDSGYRKMMANWIYKDPALFS